MTLPFDHRASIVKYLETQAEKYQVQDSRSEATALRATASSIKALIDIEQGRDEVATPTDAIIHRVCAQLGYGGSPTRAEVLSHTKSPSVVRVRFAAMWIASKRLGSTQAEMSSAFNRDSSSISHALQRAEEIRAGDNEFKITTDRLAAEEIRCENCLVSLV